MMMYMRVKWIHAIPSEPVYIYSEVDPDQWERRKVEIYADGRMGFADCNHSVEGSMLSMEPLPSLNEIAADSQFDPAEISKEDFDAVWAAALSAWSNG
jgi:hypothetical protein